MQFNLIKYSAYFIGFFILVSCSTSNKVASNKLFQKRKYQKGWHINSAPRLLELAVAKDTAVKILVENTEQNSTQSEDSTSVGHKVTGDKKLIQENTQSLKTEPVSFKKLFTKIDKESVRQVSNETFAGGSLVEKKAARKSSISQEIDEDWERILRALLGVLVLFFTGIAPLAVWIAIGEGGSLNTSIKLFVGTLVLLGAFIATIIFSAIGTFAAAGGTLTGLLIFFGIAFVVMALITFFHALFVIIRGH